MSAPLRVHYTYPYAQQICIGCNMPMPYEVQTPAPELKLLVSCLNSECIYYLEKFEVLPTLLKPYVDKDRPQIKLVTQ